MVSRAPGEPAAGSRSLGLLVRLVLVDEDTAGRISFHGCPTLKLTVLGPTSERFFAPLGVHAVDELVG
jgi:hypothetical protein